MDELVQLVKSHPLGSFTEDEEEPIDEVRFSGTVGSDDRGKGLHKNLEDMSQYKFYLMKRANFSGSVV